MSPRCAAASTPTYVKDSGQSVWSDAREPSTPVLLIRWTTLADVATEHGMWYHVDGAFGALAHLSPELRPMLRGMERADSLAFDLHKWVYLPFEVGCVLVRDPEAHHQTFALTPAYLTHGDRGLAAGPILVQRIRHPAHAEVSARSKCG